jgi:hypothetical protein
LFCNIQSAKAATVDGHIGALGNRIELGTDLRSHQGLVLSFQAFGESFYKSQVAA